MQVNQHARDKSSLLNRLGDFMESANLSRTFQFKILSLVDFEHDSERGRGKVEEVLSLLCPNLACDLKLFLHSSMFTSIRLFNNIIDDRRELFIVALWDHLACMLFPALSRIADFSKSKEACGLYFVTKGSAVVLHDSGAVICSVPHGSHYGENILMGKGNGPEGLELWSVTNVETLFLSRDSFQEVVKTFGGLIAEQFGVQPERGEGGGAGGGGAMQDESTNVSRPVPAHVLLRWGELAMRLTRSELVREMAEGGGANKNISEIRQFSAAVAKCLSPSSSLPDQAEISPIAAKEEASKLASIAVIGEEVNGTEGMAVEESAGVLLGGPTLVG